MGWSGVAYAVRTPRCIVRVYEPGDVDALHDAVRENVDALRPWMPWIADEPMNRADRVELVRRFRGNVDLGTNFTYGVFDLDGAFLGSTGLHPKSVPEVLEIGYWIVRPRWGEGLATEVAAAMSQVALRSMGAVKVEIRASPDNIGSWRVPQKLGFVKEGVLRRTGPIMGAEDAQHSVVYGLLAEELAGSPADAVEIETRGFEGR